ncbi:hypothetical protein SNOG_03850 [Parastagonospora nodorum SN15]|uniref:Uncharacterized protein n=1 Tax=Phaeosphaeria nodorum (strain SN15 / ATCC MYA-4574 / FGSC 10173) TaxID=321614 RepID=Q0UWL4_PHANO|nr:hypothetical protein SNOG_03850 [Parastagonospora nodorum SN15]EAT89055.1 hypothetical protein SNOG_03850 [Parastagonospora nodorum SN15]
MTDVLYQLVKNPKTLEKLIEEIDDALNEEEDQPKDGVIPCDKMKYMPYLRTGLDESLRLFPTTPHGLPREIPPDGIQEAFLLLCLPSSRTGSSQNFPRADQDISERWLGEEGKSLQSFILAFFSRGDGLHWPQHQ